MEIGPVREIVLLGGGEILRRLVTWANDSQFTVKVITSPRHVSEELDGKSLRNFLENTNIDFIAVEEIQTHEVKKFLGRSVNTLYLSLGAAWIFKDDILKSVFQDKLLNCHGTRLPNNRGGGGFTWQILMGNRFGFSLVHKVDAGIDTGQIISYEEFLYPASLRTPRDFETFYIDKTFTFLTRFILAVQESSLSFDGIKQSEYFSSYWPRLNSEINGWINWGWMPADIDKFICAFDDPYPGAQTFLNNQKVYLKGASLSTQDGFFHPFQSGLIYRVSDSWICVATHGATLVLENVYNKNGESLLKSLKPGDRFITPESYLSESFARGFYTPTTFKSEASN
jgi:methionyl-tRNA formyltransferase